MAGETEVERMVVRLLGDAKQYIDEMRKAREESAKAKEELKQQKGARNEAAESSRKLAETMRQGETVTRSVETSSKRYGREVSELKRLLAAGAISQETYNKVLQKTESQYGKVATAAKKLTSIGKQMSLKVTAPLAAMGALASRESMAFEDSLSKIVGLVGVARGEVKQYREQIMGLAGATGKSPTELAEAMFVITSGGLRGADAMEALEVSSKAAAGGMGEVKSVADAATSAMNAYGKANLSATRATEILTAAVRAGKADAATFAPQFGQLLPNAKAMGITFDQVAGSLAFLTKTTGNASLAATGFKGVLRALDKPAKEVEKRLAQAEIKMEDLQRLFAERSLPEAMKELENKLKSAGIAVKDFFTDSEGRTAARQMLGSYEDLSQVIGDVSNSVGIVDDAFNAAAETAGFKMRQALAGMKSEMIKLGDMIAPVVSALRMFSVGLMQVFGMLPAPIQKTAVVLGALLAAMGPVMVLLGSMANSVGRLATMYRWLTVAVNRARLAMIALKTILAVAVVYALYKAFTLLTDATLKSADASRKHRDEFEKNATEAKGLISELQQLNEKESLSTQEHLRAEQIVRRLTREYGDLGFKINETTGKWELASDTLERHNRLLAGKELRAVQKDLKDARKKLKELQDQANEPTSKGLATWEVLKAFVLVIPTWGGSKQKMYREARERGEKASEQLNEQRAVVNKLELAERDLAEQVSLGAKVQEEATKARAEAEKQAKSHGMSLEEVEKRTGEAEEETKRLAEAMKGLGGRASRRQVKGLSGQVAFLTAEITRLEQAGADVSSLREELDSLRESLKSLKTPGEEFEESLEKQIEDVRWKIRQAKEGWSDARTEFERLKEAGELGGDVPLPGFRPGATVSLTPREELTRKRVNTLEALKEESKAMEEQKKQAENGRKELEKHMTPLQKYADRMEQLKKYRDAMRAEGTWGAEQQKQFERAAEEAKKTLDEATKDRTVNVKVQFGVEGMTKGSKALHLLTKEYEAGLGGIVGRGEPKEPVAVGGAVAAGSNWIGQMISHLARLIELAEEELAKPGLEDVAQGNLE